MVRDRLAEMQAKTSEDSDSKSKKKEKNGTPLLSSEQQLTDCLSRVTELDNKIKKVKEDIEVMVKLGKNILSNPLIHKSEVEKLEQASDKILNSTNQIQKEIISYRAEVGDLYLDSNHERVIKTHLDRLSSEVSKTTNTFRAAQVEYINKSEKLHHKKVEIVGAEAGGADSSDPSSNQALFGADFLLESQKAKLELREIEARDQEIKKIENSVVEVNRLFKEINALIMEQGETIDTIEKHVMETEITVENGVEQLQQARTYRDKARRKKVCCIGIIVAVLLIVGVIIVIVVVNNNKKE
ncbi:syntaxin-1A homolog [Mya arenaria]|uniref:syntaxin-1A homolog n=1 Tax=Mya arenaria TaxID=6604 RepID=UPI0022E4D7F4|nr:syntaxin-1A homolog [Mya arenaria]